MVKVLCWCQRVPLWPLQAQAFPLLYPTPPDHLVTHLARKQPLPHPANYLPSGLPSAAMPLSE